MVNQDRLDLPYEPEESWTIRAPRPGDEEALVALFSRVFGRPISTAHWRWKLRTRPAHYETVWLAAAAEDDRPVFHYGGIAHRFWLQGQEVAVVHAVDAMADPDFRRRGMLTRVAGHAQEQWGRAGVLFTTGMPNEKWGSRAQALGWQPLFPLRWLVQPLRLESYLARYLHLPGISRLTGIGRTWRAFWRQRFRPDPQVSVSPLTQAGPEVDQLWQRCRPDSQIGLVRDADWVNWRFLQAPDFDYTVLLARRGPDPAGYLAYRQAENNGRPVGLLADMLAGKDDHGAQAALLQAAFQRLLAAGAESAVAQAAPDTWLCRALRRAGFWPTQKDFTVQMVPLASDLPLDKLRQAKNWHISGADFDVL